MSPGPALFALAQTVPDKGRLFIRFWWLWLGLFLLGLIAIRIVASAAAARRRAARLRAEGGGRRRPIKDAWSEAGKRAAPVVDEPDQPDADRGPAP